MSLELYISIYNSVYAQVIKLCGFKISSQIVSAAVVPNILNGL